MDRVELAYKPQWEGPLEQWAQGYITNNAWRFPRYVGIDDVMQDAWMIFHLCKERYPAVQNARHFGRLFGRAVINHVTDLARRRTNKREWEASAQGEDFTMDRYSSTANEYDELELALLIEDAPAPIAKIIRNIYSTNTPIRRITCRGRRVLLGDLVAKLAGFRNQTDAYNAMRSWLETGIYEDHQTNRV